jgi:acyl-CoA reductase-like NAD-dependent aldehyde dehydrogenase
MCLINSIVPGLLAGNSLLLKPSPQTPSPAIRLAAAFEAAGLPKNVLQVLHLESADTLRLAADGRVAFVAFTGSVAGGKGIDRAAAEGAGFKGVGLELGGKDPAYVRGDVDVAWAADNLVDGAMFNSGQRCGLFLRGSRPGARV